MTLRKLVTALIFLILLTAGGVIAYLSLSLDNLVKKSIETLGPSITGTTVTLGSANLSPFSGSGSLHDLTFGNPKGYEGPSSVHLRNITIHLNLKSLLQNTILIESIVIQEPELYLIGTTSGTNLQKIIRNIKSASNPESKAASTHLQKQTLETNTKTFRIKSVEISKINTKVKLDVYGQSIEENLNVPEIRLTDLGSDGSGLTVSQLFQQILNPLLNSVIGEGIRDASKRGLIQLEKSGGTSLGNVLKGIIQ